MLQIKELRLKNETFLNVYYSEDNDTLNEELETQDIIRFHRKSGDEFIPFDVSYKDILLVIVNDSWGTSNYSLIDDENGTYLEYNCTLNKEHNLCVHPRLAEIVDFCFTFFSQVVDDKELVCRMIAIVEGCLATSNLDDTQEITDNAIFSEGWFIATLLADYIARGIEEGRLEEFLTCDPADLGEEFIEYMQAEYDKGKE